MLFNTGMKASPLFQLISTFSMQFFLFLYREEDDIWLGGLIQLWYQYIFVTATDLHLLPPSGRNSHASGHSFDSCDFCDCSSMVHSHTI